MVKWLSIQLSVHKTISLSIGLYVYCSYIDQSIPDEILQIILKKILSFFIYHVSFNLLLQFPQDTLFLHILVFY